MWALRHTPGASVSFWLAEAFKYGILALLGNEVTETYHLNSSRLGLGLGAVRHEWRHDQPTVFRCDSDSV